MKMKSLSFEKMETVKGGSNCARNTAMAVIGTGLFVVGLVATPVTGGFSAAAVMVVSSWFGGITLGAVYAEVEATC